MRKEYKTILLSLLVTCVSLVGVRLQAQEEEADACSLGYHSFCFSPSGGYSCSDGGYQICYNYYFFGAGATCNRYVGNSRNCSLTHEGCSGLWVECELIDP